MLTTRTPRFRPESLQTLKLALPLALGQLAQVGMGLTDTIMLGALGGEAIAAGGLASGLYFILAMIMQGPASAVAILVAHARGAEAPERIAPAVRAGLVLALGAIVPLGLILWNIEPFLLMLGEPPRLTADMAAYARVLSLGAPALMMVSTLRVFLAAMHHPRVVMTVAFGGLLMNGLLNYALIHGHWGMPQLGFLGSAAATSITTWTTLTATYIWTRFIPDATIHVRRGPIDMALVREMFHLGWPIAITFAVEALLFLSSGLMMGLIGTTEVAAHQVTLNVASTTFMVPLAFSNAANVRVGFHMGAGNPAAARMAGLVAFALGVGFMAVAAVVMFAAPVQLAILFNLDPADAEDAAVIAVIVRLMMVGAFFQVFDGAQSIAVGALRGLKDTRIPMWLAGAGYWGIGFPTAWLLGFPLGVGPSGIWWGLAVGLAVVAAVLCVRFLKITARMTAEARTQMAPGHSAVI